jgi:hypothetical protein
MPRYETDEQRLVARRETNRKYYEKTRENRLMKQKVYDAEHRGEIRIKRKLARSNRNPNMIN